MATTLHRSNLKYGPLSLVHNNMYRIQENTNLREEYRVYLPLTINVRCEKLSLLLIHIHLLKTIAE